jgi:hypothetical protein
LPIMSCSVSRQQGMAAYNLTSPNCRWYYIHCCHYISVDTFIDMVGVPHSRMVEGARKLILSDDMHPSSQRKIFGSIAWYLNKYELWYSGGWTV